MANCNCMVVVQWPLCYSLAKLQLHELCLWMHCIAELEITVGHRTFSVHIAQISEHSSVCAYIMSRHSLEQLLSTVVAYSHNLLFIVHMGNNSLPYYCYLSNHSHVWWSVESAKSADSASTVAATHGSAHGMVKQNLKCLNKTDHVRTLCLHTFKSLFQALYRVCGLTMHVSTM